MKTKNFYGMSVLLFFLTVYLPSAIAHDSLFSHRIFKALGDGHRALMDQKQGMGASLFSLHAHLEATITNTNKEGTRESSTQNLIKKLGTAFIVDCDGCRGRYLLTNNHTTDMDEKKKEFTEHIQDLLSFPAGVSLKITETYKMVDQNGISFLVSLVAHSDSLDIALFRFEKEITPPRKSFILQNEGELLFSPIAILGSPFGISNTLSIGNVARDGSHQCDSSKKQEYLVIMAPINPGNSGGPVYNLESDKVNGMATLYLTNGESNSMIVCAVPASTLIQFLKENVPPQK